MVTLKDPMLPQQFGSVWKRDFGAHYNQFNKKLCWKREAVLKAQAALTGHSISKSWAGNSCCSL